MKERFIVQKMMATMAAALGLAACGGEVSSATIDCAASPGQFVELTADTLTKGTYAIGEVDANKDWTSKVTIEAMGQGELRINADGFGPELHYNDIRQGGGWEMENVESGGLLTMHAPGVENAAKYAPIVFKYQCPDIVAQP